jgi:hypothetical protein
LTVLSDKTLSVAAPYWLQSASWANDCQAWLNELQQVSTPLLSLKQQQALVGFLQREALQLDQSTNTPIHWFEAGWQWLYQTLGTATVSGKLANEPPGWPSKAGEHCQGVMRQLALLPAESTGYPASWWEPLIEALFDQKPSLSGTTATSDTLHVLTYEDMVGVSLDWALVLDWSSLTDNALQHRWTDTLKQDVFSHEQASSQASVAWRPSDVLNTVLTAWAGVRQGLWLVEATATVSESPFLKSGFNTSNSQIAWLRSFLGEGVLQTLLMLSPDDAITSLPLDPTTLSPQEHQQTPAIPTAIPNAIPNAIAESLQLIVPQTPSTLFTSVTGIEKWLKCRRSYYYSTVLKLPTTTPQDALMRGNLLHLIMEQFNQQATRETHTASQLIAIATTILQPKAHQSPISQALSSIACQAINAHDAYQYYVRLPALTRKQWEVTLLAGLHDLEHQGYFNHDIVRVQAEYTEPEGFTIKGLPNVQFKMSMDAIQHHANGQLTLLDYKAYGSNRYNRANSNSHIATVLTPLPPLAKGLQGYDKTVLDHRPYQLPLYAYALQDRYQQSAGNDNHFALNNASLQLLRPRKDPHKPETGSVRLTIDAKDLLDNRDALLDNLRETVIEPLREDTTFAPNPSSNNCKHCPYIKLCPAFTTANTHDDPDTPEEA